MPLDLPINSPLTDSQAELTSKIGAMKSLLAIPSIAQKNIPKANQISPYDYMIKILSAMGLTPEIVFNSFLSKIFDIGTNFLETKVIEAIAYSIAKQGIQLSPYIDNSLSIPTDITSYSVSNATYLRGKIPNNFLSVVKQKIAKDLVVMIFGPATVTPNSLNSNQAEVTNLINNAICGEGLFSLSSDPWVENHDIEYNKIKLKQQLSAGTVVFEISCQQVKIQLPANPGFIFNGGGPTTTSSGVPPTPAQSLNFMLQHVNNQTQMINNETNSNKAGKSFFQILIEKLLYYISVLVQPYLPAASTFIDSVNMTPAQQAQVNSLVFYYDNCAIAAASNSTNPADASKKNFSKSLFNALLKDLLKLLLLFLIKKFKSLVLNYFAKKSTEKQRRKLEKAKLRYQTFSGTLNSSLSKIQKYESALITINGILS